MSLAVSSLIYYVMWLLFIRQFLQPKKISLVDYKALRKPFFILSLLFYMGLLGNFDLVALLPVIEGFDKEHLYPMSYYNIDGQISLRSQSLSNITGLLTFFVSGVTWWSFLLLKFNKHPVSKVFIIDHIKIHFLLTLTFALSQKYYLLGTDSLGQDLFIQSFFAIKTGLSFAFIAMSFSIFIGVSIGLLSGWSRGALGYFLDYFYNVVNSIPSILLLILVLYFVNEWSQSLDGLTSDLYQEVSMFALALSLALTGWVPLCRLVRGQVFILREAEFIQVLQLMKVPSFKIFFKHILPHLRGILLLTMIFDLSQYLLAEALLTFIGIGFSGDLVSFGMIINENRYALLNTPIIWWPLFTVFMTLTPLVLSLNMICDYIERTTLEKRGYRDVRD